MFGWFPANNINNVAIEVIEKLPYQMRERERERYWLVAEKDIEVSYVLKEKVALCYGNIFLLLF